MTELMLFGGLFLAFTVYRMYYPRPFIAGSADMNIALGATNTAVLICSSFTMALAVFNAEIGNRRLVTIFLLSTMVLGLILWESNSRNTISTTWITGRPARTLSINGPDPAHVQMFFVLYFAMTGLHALHMFVGEGLLTGDGDPQPCRLVYRRISHPCGTQRVVLAFRGHRLGVSVRSFLRGRPRTCTNCETAMAQPLVSRKNLLLKRSSAFWG